MRAAVPELPQSMVSGGCLKPAAPTMVQRPLVAACYGRADGARRFGGVQHVVSLEQPVDRGGSLSQCAQDQRPVGDGFVAGGPAAAAQGPRESRLQPHQSTRAVSR
jgi:hypothetical protein